MRRRPIGGGGGVSVEQAYYIEGGRYVPWWGVIPDSVEFFNSRKPDSQFHVGGRGGGAYQGVYDKKKGTTL